MDTQTAATSPQTNRAPRTRGVAQSEAIKARELELLRAKVELEAEADEKARKARGESAKIGILTNDQIERGLSRLAEHSNSFH